jgi:transcriptional regulator GlxA family with amidase domain
MVAAAMNALFPEMQLVEERDMRFAFLVYPGVEPIDLAAYGVLSMARRFEPSIECWTVGARQGPVAFASGLQVIASHGYDDCPAFDVLIIPGGPGWKEASSDSKTLEFLRRAPRDSIVCSVCTGAMILAAAGMLDGLTATTKCQVTAPEESPLAVLAKRYPGVNTVAASYVDNGRIVTGGGVTLCIDTVLHLLERCYNPGLAKEVARTLEYTRAWKANREGLPAMAAEA